MYSSTLPDDMCRQSIMEIYISFQGNLNQAKECIMLTHVPVT
jgi:hypothetical protein